MARHSEGPWLRAGRGWYVQVNGRQRKLGPVSLKKSDAVRLWRQALERARTEDQGGAEPAGSVLLGRLCAEYLKHLRGRRDRGEFSAETYRTYVRWMADLPEKLGHKPADKVRPCDVMAWLDDPARARWGRSVRYQAVAKIRAMYRWALRSGLLAADPLIGLGGLPSVRRRDVTVDPEAWARLFAEIRSPQFRAFARFLFLTGCRPGEAAKLEARHLVGSRAELPAAEHKTGEATGEPRIIELVPEARDLVQAQARLYPTGALFRNSGGRAWTAHAWGAHLRDARARAGLDGTVVAHGFRHLFATDLLNRDASLAVVAAALGHRTTAYVSQTYGHLDRRRDHVREAIEKTRGTARVPDEQGEE